DATRKIAFTGDIWSNKSHYPFLVVTAHWIGRNKSTRSLHLHLEFIAFHHL
ncbi:hypothetical protein L208DRAFT_1077886, partial [Tricholoma matsutake]